ncbi:MAG: F0F1 ATP synthase subunit gamma [Acetobacteraceae bacterium]
MTSLKELRARITGVKSQRKITSAMKMVAASKLRRFQTRAEASRPYAEAMRHMMAELVAATPASETAPILMRGGQGKEHLVIMLTSDLGLAGGFNAQIGRAVRSLAGQISQNGETLMLLPLGRKGGDIAQRAFPSEIVEKLPGTGGKEVPFDVASQLSDRIISMLEKGEIDKVSVVYNRFVNAMTQTPVTLPLVPLAVDEEAPEAKKDAPSEADQPLYSFEPDEESLLEQILPRNLKVQLYAALLESAAGEQGARMAAMDNATRNAGKAIDRLSQHYNRTRQANITRELIEIISGAEAV